VIALSCGGARIAADMDGAAELARPARWGHNWGFWCDLRDLAGRGRPDVISKVMASGLGDARALEKRIEEPWAGSSRD
jgi:hypothetical protein